MAERIKAFRCSELERICGERGLLASDLSFSSEFVSPLPENGSDEIHTFCYTGMSESYYHGDALVVAFPPAVLQGDEFKQEIITI